MLQRLALYATLGLVLDAVELHFNTLGFWLILALFIANSWLSRREVMDEIQEELARIRAAKEKINE